jgi:hypothetical protein
VVLSAEKPSISSNQNKYWILVDFSLLPVRTLHIKGANTTTIWLYWVQVNSTNPSQTLSWDLASLYTVYGKNRPQYKKNATNALAKNAITLFLLQFFHDINFHSAFNNSQNYFILLVKDDLRGFSDIPQNKQLCYGQKMVSFLFDFYF